MVKAAFVEALSRCGVAASSAETMWQEVARHYSETHRHYHNLQHLDNMLGELNAIAPLLANRDAALFALVYHDIVYNPLSKKNEAKSAALARRRLTEIGYGHCPLTVEHILATQHHLPASHPDTDYFTDADLSILGKPWAEYEAYTHSIRREYRIYPDLMYKPGRRKVLQHFLALPKIFKTPPFYERYEAQARTNLAREQVLLA